MEKISKLHQIFHSVGDKNAILCYLKSEPYHEHNRDPQVSAEDHCAINVALYGAGGKRWTMTERSRASVTRGTSEFAVSGLTELPSERVAAPAVKESPVQYECRLHSETALGNSFLVIGEVVLAHVADDVFTGDRVDPAKLAAVGRLGGELYAPLREVVKVQRPRVSRETGQPLD